MADKTIKQPDCDPVRVRLGELGYLSQGDGLIVIERESALALSDMLVAWALSHPMTTPTPVR